jgi:5-phospho-D-xylono-1,4-lactonase
VPIVRTVLDDIAPSRLGIVDSHDHLFITGGPAVTRDADLRLDDLDDAVRELEEFRRQGGGTVVDAMPSSCGRDALALREASKRTGVHVLATAGWHSADYYDDGHWLHRYPDDVLARALLDECVDGIDRYDYTGPYPERTSVRPGLLKVATGFWRARPSELAAIRAVGVVHRVTGLPVLTHTEHGTYAPEQLDLLEDAGVPAHRVILSHLDRNPDVALHRRLADRGATLCFDGLYRERYRPVSDLIAAAEALIEDGYGDRLVLGADIARRSLRRSAGAPGIAGLLTTLAPALQERLGDETIRQLLVDNPARAFAFDPVTTTY